MSTDAVALERQAIELAKLGNFGTDALEVNRALTAVARKIAHGELRLEPGGDVASALRGLKEIDGVGERLATSIVMRALGWPDAFPLPDRALQRASGASTPGQLRERAESWRPWRAYAAVHLWLEDEAQP